MTYECEECGVGLARHDGPGQPRRFCSIYCSKKSARTRNRERLRALDVHPRRGELIISVCKKCGEAFDYTFQGWVRVICRAGCKPPVRSKGVCFACGADTPARTTSHCDRCKALPNERNRELAESKAFDPTCKRRCKDCSRRITRLPNASYCEECAASRERASRALSHAKGQMLGGARYECFDPIDLFHHYERTCQACGMETPWQFRGDAHPSAPIFFHIKPLADGGDHTRENCTLICRGCLNDRASGALSRLKK